MKEMGSKSEQLQKWLDRNKPKADALEAAGGIDWDAGVWCLFWRCVWCVCWRCVWCVVFVLEM